MSKESHVQLDGSVIKWGRGGIFKVKISDTHIVTARLSGRMKRNKIRVVLGDLVSVSVSSYDLSKGFITLRLK